MEDPENIALVLSEFHATIHPEISARVHTDIPPYVFPEISPAYPLRVTL